MEDLVTKQDHMRPGWKPPTSWFQSRAYWRVAAERVFERQDLVEEAIERLKEDLQRTPRDHGHPYLVEWMEILLAGPVAISKVLTSPDDDKSQVLRSMCPIRGLVSQEERSLIYQRVANEVASFRREHQE